MPARVVIPGIAHHITQRGNYQQIIFHSGDDREEFDSIENLFSTAQVLHQKLEDLILKP